jgi:hypothetical protein
VRVRCLLGGFLALGTGITAEDPSDCGRVLGRTNLRPGAEILVADGADFQR